MTLRPTVRLCLGVVLVTACNLSPQDAGDINEATGTDGGSQTDGGPDGVTGMVPPNATADGGASGDSTSGGDDGSTAAGDDDGSTAAGDDSGSSGDGALPTISMACDDDEDCVVVDDCCECEAYSSLPSECLADCEATVCESQGTPNPTAECRLGVCAFEAYECTNTACMFPALCPDGTQLLLGGQCGEDCVPEYLCDALPSCTHEMCGPGWMCVQSQSGAIVDHCEPIPTACNGTPGCDCVAPEWDACEAGCIESGDAVVCADGG